MLHGEDADAIPAARFLFPVGVPRIMTFNFLAGLILLSLVLPLAGCEKSSDTNAQESANEVVIYFSIDEPFAAPLIKRFEAETGIKVRYVTDSEANKTAGLVEKIEAEKDNPQADVYWGNEIFHTLNLAGKGLFTAYRPSTAEDVPARWRDAGNLYTGLGLRARVIGVSSRPELKEQADKIQRLADLIDPALKGKIAMSHPGFGTTSGHVAALYVLWGEAKYIEFMKGLRANDIKLLGGNSAVTKQVAAGNFVAGLTDNDDVSNLTADGGQINAVVPDQADGEVGTLLIPSTIALLNRAPHTENGKRLIDYLCDPAIEKELIAARFFAYSVRDTHRVNAMTIDYAECARQIRHAVEIALTILQDRQ